MTYSPAVEQPCCLRCPLLARYQSNVKPFSVRSDIQWINIILWSSHLNIWYMCLPPLLYRPCIASDCSDFMRGRLAAVWSGSLCICPSRHCWVHSHRDPAAKTGLPNPLTMCPYKQYTTCWRQRKRQEENLATPGYTGRRPAHGFNFKSETVRNTSVSAVCLYERPEECVCRKQQSWLFNYMEINTL